MYNVTILNIYKGGYNMKKQLAALSISVVMCLSLAACNSGSNSPIDGSGSSPTSQNSGSDNKTSDSNEQDSGTSAAAPDVMTFAGYSNNVPLGKPDSAKTSKEILIDYKYQERDLYGRFYGENVGKDGETFGTQIPYTNLNGKYPALCDLEYAEEITVLPYKIDIGSANFSDLLTKDHSHNWIRMFFRKNRTRSGKTKNDSKYYIGAYEIKDNKKLAFYPLKDEDTDRDNKVITYWLYANPIEFDFDYDGTYLILSKDGQTFKYNSRLGNDGKLSLNAYSHLSNDSEKIDDLDAVNLVYNNGKGTLNLKSGDDTNSSGIAELTNDGLFTMTYVRNKSDDTQEITTHQFVLFYQNNAGLAFTDGEKSYYYQAQTTSSSNKYKFIDMTQRVSNEDQNKADSLSQSSMKQIAEKNNNLITDLAKAFEDEGLNVVINEATGEIILDANVIFGGDSSALSNEGKAMLQKAMKAYTKTIYSDKYKGFVTTTYVEGHTAPVAGSTYESGLPLSEERANVVKDYCLSSECGVDAAYLPELNKSMVAVGYSNSKPIRDADGNVDLDASRRVSFHYLINLDG